MSGLQGMPPELIRQYSAAYGPYTPGDYSIGQHIDNREASGTVIWSYLALDGRGLVYVLDDNSGFPVEVPASKTIA